MEWIKTNEPVVQLVMSQVSHRKTSYTYLRQRGWGWSERQSPRIGHALGGMSGHQFCTQPQRRGQHPKLSQDLSATKSYFECSFWILSVMHTASYNRKKAVILMLMQVWFLLHGHTCFVTNGRNSHFFSGWRTVQSFRGWTYPLLASVEGQLHAQDELEGDENQFWYVKDAQTVHHWEPWNLHLNSKLGEIFFQVRKPDQFSCLLKWLWNPYQFSRLSKWLLH